MVVSCASGWVSSSAKLMSEWRGIEHSEDDVSRYERPSKRPCIRHVVEAESEAYRLKQRLEYWKCRCNRVQTRLAAAEAATSEITTRLRSELVEATRDAQVSRDLCSEHSQKLFDATKRIGVLESRVKTQSNTLRQRQIDLRTQGDLIARLQLESSQHATRASPLQTTLLCLLRNDSFKRRFLAAIHTDRFDHTLHGQLNAVRSALSL